VRWEGERMGGLEVAEEEVGGAAGRGGWEVREDGWRRRRREVRDEAGRGGTREKCSNISKRRGRMSAWGSERCHGSTLRGCS
jgi:hypothetical protein